MKNLEEANINKLYNYWKDYDIGIISAYREKNDSGQDFEFDPNNKSNTVSKYDYVNKSNREKASDLGKRLSASPYRFISVIGGYPSVKGVGDTHERSYFIVNDNKTSSEEFEDFMFDLCKKYGQDSIFLNTKKYPSGLYTQNREPKDFGNGPEINKNKLVTGADIPFYTRVNGSKFTFESTEGKSMFRQLVERVLAENGYEDFLQKSIEDLQLLDSQIKSLNEYGEVRIADPLQRKQLINYCNSDEGFEKCDFDPNDLRVEDDLIYLA